LKHALDAKEAAGENQLHQLERVISRPDPEPARD
jgi:hypothetical protein